MTYEQFKIKYEKGLRKAVINCFPELKNHTIKINWDKRVLEITPEDYPDHYKAIITRSNISIAKIKRPD